MTDPPLTTVSQPIEEMGRRAAELLAEEISGKKSSKSKIILTPELVVRQSTAPPFKKKHMPKRAGFDRKTLFFVSKEQALDQINS